MPPNRSRNTEADAAWARAFGKLVAQKEKRPVGEEWKMMGELITMAGRGDSYMHRIILKGVKNGTLEKFSGVTKGPTGKMGRQVWYRPLPENG